MNLNELMMLEGQTQNKIIKTLRNCNLQLSIRKKELAFIVNIFDELPDCWVCMVFQRRKLSSINLFFQYDQRTDGDKILASIKGKLIEAFGIPKNDNSNHQKDNIFIWWDCEREIYLFKTDSANQIHISIPVNTTVKKGDKSSTYRIALFGGLAWGTVFFLSMGASFGYNLINFVVSMAGGIVWGLLVFPIMLRSRNHNFNKKPELAKKDIALFKKHEKENNLKSGHARGIISFSLGKRAAIRKATIYLDEDGLNIAYINIVKIKTKKLDYNSITSYELYTENSLAIFFDNGSGMILSDCENMEAIVRKLDEIFGYDNEYFLRIQNIVYECITEWDPMSLIAGGAERDLFVFDAKNITMGIYNESFLTHYKISDLLQSYFQDMAIDDWSSLAIRIYKRLEEEKLLK